MMGVIFLAQYLWVQEEANPPDSSWPHWLGFLEMSSKQASPCVGSCLSEVMFPLLWPGLLQGFCPFLSLIIFLSFIWFPPLFLSLFHFLLDLRQYLAEPNITIDSLNLVKIMLSPRVQLVEALQMGIWQEYWLEWVGVIFSIGYTNVMCIK